MKGNHSHFYSSMHGVYILSFKISTLGSMSTLWVWSLQVINNLTACQVFPSSLHPPNLTKYSCISSKIRLISERSVDMLWNSARKTTRSASDFLLLLFLFRETHTVKYFIINNSLNCLDILKRLSYFHWQLQEIKHFNNWVKFNICSFKLQNSFKNSL